MAKSHGLTWGFGEKDLDEGILNLHPSTVNRTHPAKALERLPNGFLNLVQNRGVRDAGVGCDSELHAPFIIPLAHPRADKVRGLSTLLLGRGTAGKESGQQKQRAFRHATSRCSRSPTMKLRAAQESRPLVPRAHNLPGARGAKPQAHHGPLQRLLDARAR